MKTSRGIYLDIEESDYTYEYLGLTFYFTSEFLRDKFTKKIEDFIKIETLKIVNRYSIPLDFSIYLALSLYRRLETRGYKVQKEGKNLSFEPICAVVPN